MAKKPSTISGVIGASAPPTITTLAEPDSIASLPI